MAQQQEARCARDVPGDTHRGLVVNNHFSRETFKHVLLPIWIAAYRYNDKPYRFLVNGQTGEVTGEAPYSFWKIFLACLLGAAIIGVIGYFVVQNQNEKQRQQEEQQKKQQLEDDKSNSDDDEDDKPKKKGKKGSWLRDFEKPMRGFEGRDGTLVTVPV